VKKRTKPNGRAFLYYEKFRGTAQAWPRVPLPAAPFSAEFSLRVEQCGRLLTRKDGEKWVWQFVDLSGRAHDICDPKTKSFWPEVDAAEKVGRELAAGKPKTFAALITEYKESDAYKLVLGEGSKEGYDIYLEDIRVALGGEVVAAFTPVNAQAAIDAYKEGPELPAISERSSHDLSLGVSRAATALPILSKIPRRSPAEAPIRRGRIGRSSCSFSMPASGFTSRFIAGSTPGNGPSISSR
jgi:hypothetical protein